MHDRLPTRFAYLHGFASSSLSKKGRWLEDAFRPRDLKLHRPDLNIPSFEALSFDGMLRAVDELDATWGQGEPWGLIGSSLGGWVAARWAELHPDRVARLVLLCPAFDLGKRWKNLMGAQALSEWKSRGYAIFPDGRGRPTRVHYRFYEESLEHTPRPLSPVPTRIIHGRDDTRVPLESSKHYADACPFAKLLPVEDGHDLWASRHIISEQALDFFRPSP